MEKVIINQFGEKYLVPAEHAAKFNRRSELVLFVIDLEKAISEVSDPTNLKKHLSKAMQQIRNLNRRIPAGCAKFIERTI